jgi:hypothetical protein
MTLKRIEEFGGSFFFVVQNPSNLVELKNGKRGRF